MMSEVTAEILDIPKQVLDTIWSILKMINGTSNMVDIKKYETAVEECFTAYTEVRLCLCSPSYFSLSLFNRLCVS